MSLLRSASVSIISIQRSPFQRIRRASSAVSLEYDKLVPPDGNETKQPLVILHGLL